MNAETMALPCSFCGALIPPGNHFCGRCGQPVAPAQPAGQALPPQQPMYAPLGQLPVVPPMVQAPPKPNAWRGFKTWLMVTIVIAVVGAIAAVAIPAYIVLHPGSATSGSVTSSAHFTRCAVGTSYDSKNGILDGEDTSFSVSDLQGSQDITLACYVASNANINDVTEDVLLGSPNQTGETTYGVLIDTIHGVYADTASWSQHLEYPAPGSYTWEVFYAGVQEITLHFQVTS